MPLDHVVRASERVFLLHVAVYARDFGFSRLWGRARPRETGFRVAATRVRGERVIPSHVSGPNIYERAAVRAAVTTARARAGVDGSGRRCAGRRGCW